MLVTADNRAVREWYAMSKPPADRFSDRVEDYIRYRPDYPPELLAELAGVCRLGNDVDVADIGSGTGILSRQLLATGFRVFAVEPNCAMREAAEGLCAVEERFTSVDGTAEATTLPSSSVDLVTCAQAFHWFDRHRVRPEFQRILRPDGMVALIWNERRKEGSPFLEAYETLLQRFGTDYNAVDHNNIETSDLGAFFGGSHYRTLIFGNVQRLDRTGIEGRLMSSSYVPNRASPEVSPMIAALDEIFSRHNEGGYVRLEYTTTMYLGALR